MARHTDISVLTDTRDALHRQMRRYQDGEVTADECGSIGYLGFATSYTIATKHDIERAA